jgi:hypothetical protein
MALLRVTAVALVACSAAGAEPAAAPSGAAHPEGWKQLPAMAAAASTAARADGVTIDSADAWGEPAHGCYAVWLELHGGASEAPALADQVLAGMPRIAISEVVKPTAATGVLTLAFTSLPYHGRVRAQLGKGRIAAVACFANEREPLACQAICTQLLEAR